MVVSLNLLAGRHALKRELAAAFSVSFCVSITTIRNEIRGSIKIPDLRLHISISDVCLLDTEREKRSYFDVVRDIIPAPLSWSPGGNSLLSSDLWKVWWISSESGLLYASLFILSPSLLFVCSRSQTGLRAGPQGLTCSSLFDLPGLPFGSLENRGMKVNCKFL